MISSMTGYGRGEASEARVSAVAEIRSVNSRFLEVLARLPRSLALRENDVKELVRSRISRGKINVSVSIERESDGVLPLKINPAAVKGYLKLLDGLREASQIREPVTLDHLLKFPEVLEASDGDLTGEADWELARRALMAALDEAALMRRREGSELMKDLVERVSLINRKIDEIERVASARIPMARERMAARISELIADRSVIDERRLELELALYADKLDVTEECVRFRSHNKFFLEALNEAESAGRKLNFLIQEMNREANTIGSKANDASIAHTVVSVKEELEKIREQLQNIE